MQWFVNRAHALKPIFTRFFKNTAFFFNVIRFLSKSRDPMRRARLYHQRHNYWELFFKSLQVSIFKRHFSRFLMFMCNVLLSYLSRRLFLKKNFAWLSVWISNCLLKVTEESLDFKENQQTFLALTNQASVACNKEALVCALIVLNSMFEWSFTWVEQKKKKKKNRSVPDRAQINGKSCMIRNGLEPIKKCCT